ncbi:hypothetical protein ceV_389 [Chrysochromulina ericina virus CeV-01B]|uniref:Uncharacterized protein n=1 Tax=Chrysochromulina ericina virus CeV-01B TaxID=3070830 RepID=A0A0N9QJD5_9VIRU|nr:hypothetical protein ceV_389 [Chrysochromulina ericina virus]ALH23295.1 hypothetical protein ceV_389 [Chrysochromulina ericina virus CeV-01B]
MNISKKEYAQKTTEFILYTIVIVGIFLAIAGNHALRNAEKSSSSAQSWVSATAAGYVVSAVALLFLIPFFIKFDTSKLPGKNTLAGESRNLWIGGINRILIYPLPAFITLSVLIFASTQTFMFKDRLANHNVANTYYTWINSFTFLLFLQIAILGFYSITDKNPNSVKRYLIYAIGITNLSILGITQVILQFFSTDG